MTRNFRDKTLGAQALDEAVALGCEDLGCGTGGNDAAGFHLQYVGVCGEDLADVVGDEQDGDAAFVEPQAEITNQLIAQVGFESSEGLVEQK